MSSERHIIGIAVVIAGLLISMSVFLSANALSGKLTNQMAAFAADYKPVVVSGTVAPGQANGGGNVPVPSAPSPSPPSAGPTISVNLAGENFAGNPDAAVTVVEWSDFQCPYCGRALPTVKSIEKDYGTKVRVAFKNFPLSFHDKAQKAAEASACADAQGKFWEYHDTLFRNQNSLSVGNLKQYAKDLSLDGAKFDACLDNGEQAAFVQQETGEGSAVGVQGTPTFVILAPAGAVSTSEWSGLQSGQYGRSIEKLQTTDGQDAFRIVGAVPYETFKPLLDAATN